MSNRVNAAAQLRSRVDTTLPRMRAASESSVNASRGAGKWTKKQVLGHLIDSAANNHQRFVRAQLADSLVLSGYEQEPWVAVHQYATRSWLELVDLWAALNRHLAYVIDSIPTDRLSTTCTIGQNKPVTLEWLVGDYLHHLDHHLQQILTD